jgi:hypothetical protein
MEMMRRRSREKTPMSGETVAVESIQEPRNSLPTGAILTETERGGGGFNTDIIRSIYNITIGNIVTLFGPIK